MLVGQLHERLVSSPGPVADPNIHQATIHSSGAALALVVWDALLTLDNEIDHIWSKSGRTHVKCIYLFSKWFGLVNQMSESLHQESLLCVLISIFSGVHMWHCFLAKDFPCPCVNLRDLLYFWIGHISALAIVPRCNPDPPNLGVIPTKLSIRRSRNRIL
ncbi:hypothetical protein J3R83DRAFT_8644 [Lanmaoa asiatica]|nr:hypothetical protein J3R83DRAFT_8644 [Lanmaoa asiatica]